jgi:SAM-dependent methyltransferase
VAPNFLKYSAYYDLLYADKDYAAEAQYVARTLRAAAPGVRTLLDLGSGTGRHGRLLAEMGFEVHGVERSAEMVAEANAADPPSAGAFSCEVGDLRLTRLGRRFDAVTSLFHVISYQTTNQDLQAAFRTAADHLNPGGLFLFDVWHGPAVLAQRPEARTKVAADTRRRVTRTAVPDLDTDHGTVKVTYQMDCEDLDNGETVRFGEEHLMRYLFPTEVDGLARNAGFTPRSSEEFLTGRPPSPDTWGVAYLMAK